MARLSDTASVAGNLVIFAGMADVRLLILLGEIQKEQQRELFEKELNDGFLTCPSEILKAISDKAGQLSAWENTSADGVLSLSSIADNLSISVICRPTANVLASALSKLITPPTSPDVPVYSAIVYTGLISEASAHFILPNYVFTSVSLSDQIETFAASYPKPTDAENQPPYKAINLHIACNGVNSGGEWRQLVGHSVGCIGGHNVHISVNRSQSSKASKPSAAGDNASPPACDSADIGKLVASALAAVPPNIYSSINQPLVPRNWTDPTLKVARPCLYVFPEGSGQAAIFAIPGYNMLINAGCAQHPGFWPVANHLDRLDAVLLTHWGVDNLLGLSSVLPVAFARPPDAVPDSILCLLTPPPNISGSYKLPDPNPAQSPLALSIPREMSKVMSGLKQQGTNVFAQTLTRGAKMVNPSQPVQLYQKVGQGSLELFPLTPTDEDSAELRKVTDDWAKASPSLIGATVPLGRSPPANKFTVPLLSHTSVSVLVVWKPSKDTDAILRILFVAPNAHQARVLVSLEAVVASNIYLRHSRAVPGDAERKRSTTTVPGSARRSVMPGTVGAPAKQSSVSSAGGAPAKSAPGRPSSLADKKPMSTRPVATQPRPTSKPTPANAKKESNASKPSAIPGAATKKAQSKPPATTQPVPAALSLAAETAAAIAAENDHDHTSNLLGDAPEPNPSLPTSPNNELVNNNVNGYHSEQNGAGALPGEYDADDGHGGLLISPNHPVAKTPLSATSPLSEDMMQLNMNAEPLSPARNPFEMTHSPSEPVATADLIDPMAAWGEPQGLPAPPPPGARRMTSTSSINTKAAPVQLPPGYTDASSHAAVPGSAKLPPYDKVKPIYVDVAYLPGGGNPHLVDAEFFKRVRARYYVATDPRPGPALMEALTVGKESWTGDDAQLPASLILAHETEELMIWLGRNAGRLAACHLELTAVASRSSIQLLNEQQAGSATPLACAGYRIDF